MKTALLDGDIIAFKAAAFCEARCEGDEQVCAYETRDAALNIAKTWIEKAGCDRGWVCLSDGPSFRHDIYPPYKANRSDMLKPSTLGLARDTLRKNYETLEWPGLEADDLMAIYATRPPCTNHTYVVVSTDKDLAQVHGPVYNPDKDTTYMDILPKEFKFRQWLIGDRVDNLKGIPGIGPKKAEKLYSQVFVYEDEYEVTNLLSVFRSAGIPDSTALAELNCIHILQDGDYDWVRGIPKLYYQTPEGNIRHDFDWPKELLSPSGSNPTADVLPS